MKRDAALPGALADWPLFAALGKFRLVELWLGFFVGVALIGPELLRRPEALLLLGSILVTQVAVIAATCSYDDVVGFQDGVDAANHREGARWGVTKPVLEGTLSEGRALRFAHLLAAVAAAGFFSSVALAWPLPAWMIGVFAVITLVAVNYSYGLKLSYRGAGELVIFLGAAATVLVPYGFVTGSFSPHLVFCASLVGAWNAQVVMCSNTKDAAGDRACGRMTIAASTTPRGNKRYVAGAFLAVWAATVAALASGLVSAWFLVALVPVWGAQAHQLRLGVVGEDWLAARLVGFRVLRFGVGLLGLTAAFAAGWPASPA